MDVAKFDRNKNMWIVWCGRSEKANKNLVLSAVDHHFYWIWLLLGWLLATMAYGSIALHGDESCHRNSREMSCAKIMLLNIHRTLPSTTQTQERWLRSVISFRTIEFLLSVCARCVSMNLIHMSQQKLCRWTHYSYCYCPLKSYLLHTWFFICKYESEGWYKNGIICQSNFYANGSRPSQASMCWLAHCTYTHGARSSRLIQHIIRYANLCWMHNAITFA